MNLCTSQSLLSAFLFFCASMTCIFIEICSSRLFYHFSMATSSWWTLFFKVQKINNIYHDTHFLFLGLGRIAGILTLEAEDSNPSLDALQRVGSSIAMHIVAAKPLFLSKELVSSEAIESEREILKSQVIN